jgi:hypothetical protein
MAGIATGRAIAWLARAFEGVNECGGSASSRAARRGTLTWIRIRFGIVLEFAREALFK